VFAFLKANEVGTGHALFYVAYATALEWRGAYARADAAYQQGLNRLAAPAERLRSKFLEFQARMVSVSSCSCCCCCCVPPGVEGWRWRRWLQQGRGMGLARVQHLRCR
jgi:hypothetical protein